MNEETLINITERLSKEAQKSIRLLIDSVQKAKKYDVNTLSFILSFDEELKNLVNKDLYEKFSKIYYEEIKIARDRFGKNTGQTMVFTATDAAAIDTIINADFSKIESYISYLNTDLKSQLIKNLYTGIPINREELLEKFDKKIVNNITTELRTGAMALSREITKSKVDEYFDEDEIVYLYEGSLDDVTRDFCRERVGKFYTMEEIKNMDNEQGLDPFIYGGGYNCRHEWIPMTVRKAKELGYAG